MNDLTIIILAAGKGTRMKSNRPKVLQSLAGRPLLAHVLNTAEQLGSQTNIVVYGFAGEQVKNAFTNQSIVWVEQKQQLGTGHAVKMALAVLPKTGKSLILYGDVPLIQLATLQNLLSANQTGLSMLTLSVENPFGLGRIVRDNAGKVLSIIEQKDANPQQLLINEINSGIYCIENKLLHQYLPKITNNNAQGEYYLTDIIKMAVNDGIEIATISPNFAFEIDGVNDRIQLADLERRYQAYLVENLQQQGVQFIDPSRVDIRGQLTCGQDVLIDSNVIFKGNVVLADGVTIDTGAVIKNSQIGANSHIKPYCVIEDSQIGQDVAIGPFAHLRPKTVLENHVKIGNFVEIKKTIVKNCSKINHLSYIGDANIGENVNIGAGTITCNYDGVNKFQTIIADGAFVGSNSSLVAPVTIGKGATVGAGSVISRSCPDEKLTLTRAKQTTIEHWQRPKKQS